MHPAEDSQLVALARIILEHHHREHSGALGTSEGLGFAETPDKLKQVVPEKIPDHDCQHRHPECHI